MTHTAIVSSWRGAFGFATLEDGTSIYIHTDEIGGGRLRVGREVCFDLEAVEGQEGRHKGVNVSGTAVLPKGEKLVCVGERRGEFVHIHTLFPPLRAPRNTKRIFVSEATCA